MLRALLLHFLLLPIVGICQDSEIHSFGLWTEEDKTAVIFADIANIHSEANQESETIKKLAIGTEIKIISVGDKPTNINGISAPWIKLKTVKGEGYIWGGLLCKNSLTIEGKRKAIWGIIQIKNIDEERSTFASIRIVEKGKILAQKDFIVRYADRPTEGYLTLMSTPLIEGVQNVLIYNTVSEACGVFASSHYFFYSSREELKYVGSGYSMGDGGVMHTSREFTFPFPEKEGSNQSYYFTPQRDKILRIETTGEYDEDCIWVETTKAASFTWNSEELVKSCEQ